MIPLPGHTFGHAGIAVQGEGDRWLLMAGDAYFYRGEMDQRRPHCTPGLRFYQWMLEKDRHARFESQRRLRELARDHGSAVHVCCGHDLVEFEAIAKRRAAEPATSGTTTLV
jgi:glyoxylase-like metal-dependent hydrolase (beta-lactamase superfamily II)